MQLLCKGLPSEYSGEGWDITDLESCIRIQVVILAVDCSNPIAVYVKDFSYKPAFCLLAGYLQMYNVFFRYSCLWDEVDRVEDYLQPVCLESIEDFPHPFRD